MDLGKFELYHDNGKNPASSINLWTLNNGDSTHMPAQGTGDDERIGDQIEVQKWKLRLLCGQKSDRPNCTWRLVVYQVRKGQTVTYQTIFKNVVNNCLLDTWDYDNGVKVLYDKTLKSKPGDMSATGSDEYTFPWYVTIPAPQKTYKFTSGVDHNIGTICCCMFVYDAYGSLGTDNIAYTQVYVDMSYKDI